MKCGRFRNWPTKIVSSLTFLDWFQCFSQRWRANCLPFQTHRKRKTGEVIFCSWKGYFPLDLKGKIHIGIFETGRLLCARVHHRGLANWNNSDWSLRYFWIGLVRVDNVTETILNNSDLIHQLVLKLTRTAWKV